ncbi:hypothetical protein PBI_VALIDUS_83 [Mycobacterium phage Validus]|uniref:Uncharacterized protein n=1 Tax=Mycobacterium phage Validus TaxID=1414747 RepID=V5UQW9_9CAUD|nr:hypothetical protein CC50_gp028 [Mycobacterium phage Validus]AHB79613.1 hypothetical protein PBI_VALIDUS_83 [Mycobacterium phage Validus]
MQNLTAQQMLDSILGLDRSDADRLADRVRFADDAEAASDRKVAEARAALAAGDAYRAEALLNDAERYLAQARSIRAELRAPGRR